MKEVTLTVTVFFNDDKSPDTVTRDAVDAVYDALSNVECAERHNVNSFLLLSDDADRAPLYVVSVL